MKFLFLAFCLMLSNYTLAEIGKITIVRGGADAYIQRGASKIAVTKDMDIELGDELFSENCYVIVYVYPGTQISLSKRSHLKMSSHTITDSDTEEKADSVIDYIKGIVRVQVTKDSNQQIDQKIQARGVAFGVRGTEFEISEEGTDEIDLDVIEGEVTVSSPDVHTFVPEVVKANEGFRFNRARKSFARRKFVLKFKDHPGFKNREELKKRWKELRQERRARREELRRVKAQKRDRVEKLREERKNRKQR